MDGLEVIAVPTLRAAAEVVMGARAPDLAAPAASSPRLGGASPTSPTCAATRRRCSRSRSPRPVLTTCCSRARPGTGKTMLASRLVSILPAMSRRDAVEVTRIHSVAGLCADGLITRRPFRAPHHTISAAGLVGGGSPPRPGEATLANHGVLFLDELSEFQRSSLEALRQPLEDGRVTIVRGQRALVFPTQVHAGRGDQPMPVRIRGGGGPVPVRRGGPAPSPPPPERAAARPHGPARERRAAERAGARARRP